MNRCRSVVVLGVSMVLALGGARGAAYQQSATDYRASGDRKFQARDLAGAIDDYSKAISLDPKDTALLTARGFMRTQGEQFDAALADFTQAITLDPKDAGNFAFRGYVKNLKGDLDGAIADSRQAIVLSTAALLAYKTLVDVHVSKAFRCSALTPAEKQEHVSLGLEVADRGLRIGGDDFSLLLLKGVLLRLQAGLETDEAKYKALLAQADDLRTKAQQVRASSTDVPLPPASPNRPLNCGGAAAPSSTSVSGGVPPSPLGAIRVGGEIPEPRKIKDVRPVYPQIAQTARVQGAVILEATIGVDGKVVTAAVVKSIPLLDQAAIDAVRQWEYTPTLFRGNPVEVIMTVTVTFTLR